MDSIGYTGVGLGTGLLIFGVPVNEIVAGMTLLFLTLGIVGKIIDIYKKVKHG